MSITEETATVYRSGGRRFLTRRAALRWEAKRYLKQMLRDMGEDPSEVPCDQWAGWVAKLVDQLKRGEDMAFDEEWFQDPYIGGADGVGSECEAAF